MKAFFLGVLKFFLKIFLFIVLVYAGVFLYKYKKENFTVSEKNKGKEFSFDDFPIPELTLPTSHEQVMKCPYCGGDIHGDEKVCPYCDKKKKQELFYSFEKGNLEDDKYIGLVNKWLSEAVGIKKLECNFITRDTLGIILPDDELRNITFFYTQEEEGGERFGVDILESFTLFKKTDEELLSRWRAAHEGCEIVKFDSYYRKWGSLWRGFFGGSKVKMYILYKVNE